MFLPWIFPLYCSEVLFGAHAWIIPMRYHLELRVN
jgi:hypothetical protein